MPFYPSAWVVLENPFCEMRLVPLALCPAAPTPCRHEEVVAPYTWLHTVQGWVQGAAPPPTPGRKMMVPGPSGATERAFFARKVCVDKSTFRGPQGQPPGNWLFKGLEL